MGLRWGQSRVRGLRSIIQGVYSRLRTNYILSRLGRGRTRKRREKLFIKRILLNKIGEKIKQLFRIRDK